jgi:hypothetical protein
VDASKASKLNSAPSRIARRPGPRPTTPRREQAPRIASHRLHISPEGSPAPRRSADSQSGMSPTARRARGSSNPRRPGSGGSISRKTLVRCCHEYGMAASQMVVLLPLCSQTSCPRSRVHSSCSAVTVQMPTCTDMPLFLAASLRTCRLLACTVACWHPNGPQRCAVADAKCSQHGAHGDTLRRPNTHESDIKSGPRHALAARQLVKWPAPPDALVD